MSGLVRRLGLPRRIIQLEDFRSWKTFETANAVKEGSGASGALCGLFAVVVCSFPDKVLYVQYTSPLVPQSIAILGPATREVVAWKEGCYPNIGHLCHVSGMAFGAVIWATGVVPISLEQRTAMVELHFAQVRGSRVSKTIELLY